MAKGWPKGLSIPLIGVHAHVEDIALNGPTDLHAPFKWGDVAWYDKSARPGALGHSFIFGHLDSYCCAAIFWKLKDLKRGDIIKVWYKKRVLKFRVRWQHTYPNTALPVKFMYDPTTQHGLLLITCAGAFHTDGTGYDHKLFVYARLILPNGRLG